MRTSGLKGAARSNAEQKTPGQIWSRQAQKTRDSERLRVFSAGRPSRSARNLCSLAESLGVAAEYCEISSVRELQRLVMNAIGLGARAVVLDVDSLDEVGSRGELADFGRELQRVEIPVLLLVTRSEGAVGRTLDALTARVVKGCRSIPAASRAEFPRESLGLAAELQSFGYRIRRGDRLGLDVAESAGFSEVMRVGGMPAFVALAGGAEGMFVWSTPDVFDPLLPLAAELEFEQAVDEYVPAIIFLRHAYRDRCWQSCGASAGLVIDDPLLDERYGCLDFRRLLASARSNGYHATLGFIPWNHWRTRTATAALFREYADCFSVCLHGCDHTRGEFTLDDYDQLATRVDLAAERMERHERRTGITWERLMVFPQEQFSLAAVRACADSPHVSAIVNTRCVPPASPEARVTGRQLLQPASDAMHGMPMFKRHYLEDMADFAISLFLGKPTVLAAHHDFFKDGVGQLEDFVRRLRELRPDLPWRPLSQTVARLCARRRVADNEFELHVFADDCEVRNTEAGTAIFHVRRRLSCGGSVTRVLVDGKEVDFAEHGDSIRFSLSADGPGRIRIHIVKAEQEPTQGRGALGGWGYQPAVAARRFLSEFRDRVVVPGMLAVRRLSERPARLLPTAVVEFPVSDTCQSVVSLAIQLACFA